MHYTDIERQLRARMNGSETTRDKTLRLAWTVSLSTLQGVPDGIIAVNLSLTQSTVRRLRAVAISLIEPKTKKPQSLRETFAGDAELFANLAAGNMFVTPQSKGWKLVHTMLPPAKE
jgi:hypothetical protein